MGRRRLYVRPWPRPRPRRIHILRATAERSVRSVARWSSHFAGDEERPLRGPHWRVVGCLVRYNTYIHTYRPTLPQPDRALVLRSG
eukprot:5850697-Prymnesium_polylepis.1